MDVAHLKQDPPAGARHPKGAPGAEVGEPVTFEASQLALNSSLYRMEEKVFAVGDQIVFGRNTRRGIFSADGGENSGVHSERGTIEQ